jgi:hypothetical protein
MHTPHSISAPSVKVISGRRLQSSRRRYSPTMRAVLADELVNGAIAVKDFSPRQAAAIASVRMAQVRAIRRARASAPLDYAALRGGRLDVEAARRQQLADRPISEARLRRLIQRAGPDRVLDMPDAMTMPASNAVQPAGGNGRAATQPGL